MPNNIKTYDGMGDPEDHVKVFQAAAQVERWAMPTWCHMFNSTLIGAARVWFDELPPENIDGYKDMKAAFLSYFMKQKKYVKDPVEIHNIKQRDGETLEDFRERFKIETERMKGAPECMRMSGFMHGINNPELTKRLNEHVPKTMEEMMIATTALIRGEATAASKKKGHGSWKPQDQSKKHADKMPDFQAAEANKFQPPPPMVTLVEKRNSNKFCDFHNDKGHSTDECMQLKKQIEELVRAGKLSHLIKEMKQGREQPKTGRKEAAAKDKPMTIWMHEINSQMVPATTSLTGFSGETTWPLGQLRLLVTIGDVTHSTKAWMNFMIVKSLSPYNGIIGRPGLKAIQAVPSTVYGMLKFPTKEGIVTIRSSLLILDECASIDTSSAIPKEKKTRPANLTNLDIFAWQPSDMTGVPRSIAKHRLNIREGCPPVRQKKRGQAPERTKAIQAKVQKLVEARIMREVYYHDWLSNPVMVKKHDESWRMCVNFTDLNKAYAYKGYHQIQLAAADEEKTAFHTGQGVYYYTKMPFGLKNAGATYQRLMDKAFESQMGRNIEVYVDDLVVKSHTEAEMVRDIEEMIQTLRKINMKLNPKKCSFGLAEGVFLGYVITPEGIKPCPDKTTATLKKCIKKSDFRWTTEAKQAFQQLKQHLSDLPILAAPKPQEELIMYLSTTHGAISAVLMTERGIAQMPVYFISRALQDGSSCVDGSGVGLILTNPDGVEFTYALRFQFAASNNEAEYEALIAGLRIATQIGVKNIQANVDSKLVANQVLGAYVAKEDNMIKYLEITKGLVLETKSITRKEVTAVIEEEGPTWMTELVNYLKEGILPEDEKEGRKLRLKARQYELMEGIFYKRSFLTPWLRCVGPLQAEYVMKEIHDGSCSMHARPRSVEAKAIRLGYFWPTMHKDAQDMIRKCSDWNRHSMPLSGRAGECQVPDSRNGLLHEVDKSKGGGNNYRRTGEEIRIGQYCMPFRYSGEIILDNCKQFADNPFKDWCDKLNITQRFASVKHLRSNRLVERANRSLGEGIKARLGEGNKNWVEELPHVLWAHQTMIKLSHGDTPFSLTYGTEAVIPAEIGMPTYRTTAVDVVNNDGELRLNLDLLEEHRELTAMSEAKSKSKMMNNNASHAVAGGKLGPKWEGPYEVTDAFGKWSVQAAVHRRDDASKNVECHKSQAMLPLSIGTDFGHG
nr:reverse transcriptase domain-containing protein [Tanacetum cinerariifolium]